jgi:hypothetical protein
VGKGLELPGKVESESIATSKPEGKAVETEALDGLPKSC